MSHFRTADTMLDKNCYHDQTAYKQRTIESLENWPMNAMYIESHNADCLQGASKDSILRAAA